MTVGGVKFTKQAGTTSTETCKWGKEEESKDGFEKGSDRIQLTFLKAHSGCSLKNRFLLGAEWRKKRKSGNGEAILLNQEKMMVMAGGIDPSLQTQKTF